MKYKPVNLLSKFPPKFEGMPQKYDNELTRRTELADSSGRYANKHLFPPKAQNRDKRIQVMADSVEFALGEGWVERDVRGFRKKLLQRSWSSNSS